MPTDHLDPEVRRPHGFHADYRPSYRETPAKDGWQRLRTWFQQNGAA